MRREVYFRCSFAYDLMWKTGFSLERIEELQSKSQMENYYKEADASSCRL